MKIYPLLPEYGAKIKGKIRRIDKRLSRDIFVEDKETGSVIESLIVLANGHGDDIVVGILCKHLNGKRIVGLVKSEKTRISSIENIDVYMGRVEYPLKNLVFIMDQEYDSLEDIHNEIEKEIDKFCTPLHKEEGKRYLIYDCKWGSRRVKLVFVINGIDSIETEKHSIEDHLIQTAKEMKISNVPQLKDAKQSWNKLDEKIRKRIFKELISNKKLAKEIFNQHFKGFEFIER